MVFKGIWTIIIHSHGYGEYIIKSFLCTDYPYVTLLTVLEAWLLDFRACPCVTAACGSIDLNRCSTYLPSRWEKIVYRKKKLGHAHTLKVKDIIVHLAS